MIHLEEILKNKTEYKPILNEDGDNYTYLIFLIKDNNIVYITHSQKGEQHLTTMKNKIFDSYYIKKINISDYSNELEIVYFGDIIALLCFKYQPIYNDTIRFKNCYLCKNRIDEEIKNYGLRDNIPNIIKFKKLCIENNYKINYLHGSMYILDNDLYELLDKIANNII